MNLSRLSTKDLQARFQAAFGKTTPSRNRPWLIKRLTSASAPQIQTQAPVEVAPPPAAVATAVTAEAEPQAPAEVAIPPVGSEIRKTWRGQELVVRVQADGFLVQGTVYRSLSAAATALCGGNRNGLVFFGLKPRPAKAAQETGGAA